MLGLSLVCTARLRHTLLGDNKADTTSLHSLCTNNCKIVIHSSDQIRMKTAVLYNKIPETE